MSTRSEDGFSILSKDGVKALSPTQLLVKPETGTGSYFVEFAHGNWSCDCNFEKVDSVQCPHINASILYLATRRVDFSEPENPMDAAVLRCRYCGSPDISRAGFRYNTRGIVRRIFCNQCKRKFSALYSEPQMTGHPSGTLWLVSEVAMVTSRLLDLLTELNKTLERSIHRETGTQDVSEPTQTLNGPHPSSGGT